MAITSSYSYICYKDPDIATTWKAYSTLNETVEITSNNPSTLIQTAIDNTAALEAGGGKVLLRGSPYWGTLGLPLDIELKSKVHLIGEGYATKCVGKFHAVGRSDCSIQDLWIASDGLTTGSPIVKISNTKGFWLQGCKIAFDSATDPLIRIDDDDGGSGKFSSEIYIERSKLYTPYRGIYFTGTSNHTHIKDLYIAQTSGSRSTDVNNAGIFADNTGFKLFLTFDTIYFEKFYSGMNMNEGFWDGTRLWVDNVEYGVTLGSNAISEKAIRFDVMCPQNCGYLANINGTNYAAASSGLAKRFVYESDTINYLQRGVKY